MAKKIELRVYQCKWCDELWKNDSGIRFHLVKTHPEHASHPRPLILRILKVRANGADLSVIVEKA